MKDEKRTLIILIEFYKDTNLLDIERRKLASEFMHKGVSKTQAEGLAKAKISEIKHSQSIRVEESLDILPISDIVFDIAKGRHHKFSVTPSN